MATKEKQIVVWSFRHRVRLYHASKRFIIKDVFGQSLHSTKTHAQMHVDYYLPRVKGGRWQLVRRLLKDCGACTTYIC